MVVFLMMMTVVSAVTYYLRVKMVPLLTNLLVTCLLVVYIVSTLIFLVNPQETHSQRLILNYQNNQTYNVPTSDSTSYMLSAFYRFYGASLVSLFIVVGLCFTGTLIAAKALGHPEEAEELDREI